MGKRDIRTVSQVDLANAAGRAEIVATVPHGQLWIIQRAAITNNGVTVPSLRAYAGSEADENLVDATGNGNQDIMDNCSGIFLNGGSEIRFIWDGADVGSRSSLNMQYEVANHGGTQRTQHYPYAGEDMPYGKDIPGGRRKVTVGFGGDGF